MKENNILTKQFIELLEEQGVILTDEIASLSDLSSPEDVYETLVERGFSDVELMRVYAQFVGVPFIELHEIDPHANSILEKNLQEKFGFIPFYMEKQSKILQIALTDPHKYASLSQNFLNKLAKRLGVKIEILLAAPSQVEKALSNDSPDHREKIEVDEYTQDVLKEQIFTGKVNLQMIKEIASSGDAANLLQTLLIYAHTNRADELIMEPFENTISIKLLIDGERHVLLTIPSSLSDELASHSKGLAHLNLEQTQIPQSGRISFKFSQNESNILFSTLPTIFGERLAFKVLPSSSEVPDFKNLGFSEESLSKIEQDFRSRFGMIIVSSGKKSGRSTTIASMIKELSDRELDVISLEEEVTYTLEGVNQIVTKSDLGFGYPELLRSIFNQNPSVVAVDEIADTETAKLCSSGALSGKLVLAGMFSRDAVGALINFSYLVDEPYVISSSIKTVICQSLVRKICQHCKTEIEVSEGVEDKIKNELKTDKFMRFYRGEGCDKCRGGFAGRIVLFEVLNVTDEIVDMIISKNSPDEIRAAARQSGMITLRQDGLNKASQGLTTVDEVIKATRFEG